MTFVHIALVIVILILIYQVIFQLWFCYKKTTSKSTFGAVTSNSDLLTLLKNDKNVLYMIIQNPYTATTLTATSKQDDIIQLNTDIATLQKVKKDVLLDLYSVDNFIRSVYLNYNYTFDPSVTSLVDFSKESLSNTFDLAKRLWDLCSYTTYTDVIKFLLSDSVVSTSYLNTIRPLNILKNGDLSTPIITTNTFQSMSTTVVPNWSGNSAFTNSATTWYSVLPPVTSKQAFAIQRTNNVSQIVNLTKNTTYLLTFDSIARPGNRDGTITTANLFSYINNTVKANPLEVSLIINGVKSVIGVIIPQITTWQQDYIIFDVPLDGNYTLIFTGLWSDSDRTTSITDIILTTMTPFDYPSSDYKCKKPSTIPNSLTTSVNSTRQIDASGVSSVYTKYVPISFIQPKLLTEVQSTTPPSVLTTGGTPIVIRGINFTGTTSVKIGGTEAIFTVNSSTQITVSSVPPSTISTDVDIIVTSPQGISTLKNGLTYTSPSTIASIAKFTNPGKKNIGDVLNYGVVEKFAVVTTLPNIPVNPYLNNYIRYADGNYAFVNRDGIVRRIGAATALSNIMNVNGCPNEDQKDKFKQLTVNNVASLPLYDPQLKDGPAMVTGDSCFVDGTKVTYTNDYMSVVSNRNVYGRDIGSGIARSTVDTCRTACNANSKCAGFVFDKGTSTCFLKNNMNATFGQTNIDLYRRKAVDQKGTDVTFKTEVNPYLNTYLYQDKVSYRYVNTDGEIRDAGAKNNNSLNPGTYGCPFGKINDSEGRTGSLKWFGVGTDYPNQFIYDPPFKTGTIAMTGTEVCVNRGKPNPLLKQYIRYKSGTMFYVTDQGKIRKIPTWYILNSLSGKNACPVSTDYIQLDYDDYLEINRIFNFQPPLSPDTDLQFGDYCVAPVTNPLLGKFIQDTNLVYYYVNSLGLVRKIPNQEILNSVRNKNGCPSGSTTTTNFNDTDKGKIIQINTDDYNTLGPYVPPLLAGTDMTFNDYCTGFVPVLTDVSKLTFNTVTGPTYAGLVLSNLVKIDEIIFAFNGQILKIKTDTSSSERKEALYTFITKNYF
jgi:hypothetical protein